MTSQREGGKLHKMNVGFVLACYYMGFCHVETVVSLFRREKSLEKVHSYVAAFVKAYTKNLQSKEFCDRFSF